MASPAPIVVTDGGKSKLLLGRVAAFGMHTVVVYGAAVHLSPWLVYHWFGWIAPVLQVSISMPATDWYLQHLEIVTVVPAVILGYLDVTRFFPPTIRRYVGTASRDSVALWAWVVPATICYFLFLKGPLATSRRIGALAFLGHCIFWYWFTSDGFHPLTWGIPGYGGPVGMVLGFCALLIWGLYIYGSRELSLGIAPQ